VAKNIETRIILSYVLLITLKTFIAERSRWRKRVAAHLWRLAFIWIVRIHHLTENTLYVHYKDQSVIAVYRNSRGLSWHLYAIYEYTLRQNAELGDASTIQPLRGNLRQFGSLQMIHHTSSPSLYWISGRSWRHMGMSAVTHRVFNSA
jgi:hypothetical protein